MPQTMVQELLFELSGHGVEVELTLDADGIPERLGYRSGDDSRRFSRAEIDSARSDDGTRATVMLENGAADGPIVLLTIVVPSVTFGDDRSFDVTAAAVRTTKRSLFGRPRPGPQQSYEVFVLAGVVSGPPAEDSVGTCRDWYASHDHMPPGRATLRVSGTCTFGRPGYAVELRRHEPQGINAKDLLLDKIVIPPSGDVGAAVVTHVEVRYEEVTDFDYDSVTILPEGPSIPVQDVH